MCNYLIFHQLCAAAASLSSSSEAKSDFPAALAIETLGIGEMTRFRILTGGHVAAGTVNTAVNSGERAANTAANTAVNTAVNTGESASALKKTLRAMEMVCACVCV